MPALRGTVPERHSVKAPNAVSLRHSLESDCLARLLYHLNGDYPAAEVLFVLLQMHASRGFVKASYRCLSERCANLPFKVAARALDRLATAGLISAVSQPKVVGSYRVDAEALRRLLSQPLPEGVLIPGITPIPSLRNLFADWTAPATAESIGPSDPED